jgi:hypothetical protein
MLPSTAASFISGLQYFGDHPPNFMGLDPLFLTIAATASCAGLGYLIGPLVGSSLWRLTHRRTLSLIEARDRDFHHHIVRNRVDPTRQSATNPVPDFYGMSHASSLVVGKRPPLTPCRREDRFDEGVSAMAARPGVCLIP